MTISTVFINNRTQAVRLPSELRLPESVSPVDSTWDSFFLNGPQTSEDFLPERVSQEQSERESLE